MRTILYRPSMISPSLPYTGPPRPSLRTARRFPCPSATPMNLYGIGGKGGGGGGPAGTGGGATTTGLGAGGGGFGLNRKRSRSADTGFGRSSSSALRCTSGAPLGCGAARRAGDVEAAPPADGGGTVDVVDTAR